LAGSSLTKQAGVWALPEGASGSPLIRRIGQGFLLGSASVAVAWSAELCRDLWFHPWRYVAIPVLVVGCLAWCFQVGRLWRNWSQVAAPLRLHWTGDVAESPHWRVIEWDQPVTVRIACDLQDWMLLEVKSSQLQGRASRSVWSWVPGKDDGRSWELETPVATSHRLRALSYRKSGLEMGEDTPAGESPISQTGHRSLASSVVGKTSGRNSLFRSVFQRSRTGTSSSGVAQQNEHAHPWSATEFPPTQWLPRAEPLADLPAIRSSQREGRRT